MLASGGGAIVHNAPVAGVVGFGGMSIYTASKHAGVGLTLPLPLPREFDVEQAVVLTGALSELDGVVTCDLDRRRTHLRVRYEVTRTGLDALLQALDRFGLTPGMEVAGDTPHQWDYGGARWHFCSARCRDRFMADPGAYRETPAPEGESEHGHDGHHGHGSHGHGEPIHAPHDHAGPGDRTITNSGMKRVPPHGATSPPPGTSVRCTRRSTRPSREVVPSAGWPWCRTPPRWASATRSSSR